MPLSSTLARYRNRIVKGWGGARGKHVTIRSIRDDGGRARFRSTRNATEPPHSLLILAKHNAPIDEPDSHFEKGA